MKIMRMAKKKMNEEAECSNSNASELPQVSQINHVIPQSAFHPFNGGGSVLLKKERKIHPSLCYFPNSWSENSASNTFPGTA
jgi:hypothetical protein